ncbi:YfiT family bacillithiol transferase [Paenibacillus sp. NEAU-GSW1]|uniref:YfiT family bacillithiol transferase n=1 Tax=Paenibacillus sp. NEAU-GSW1 TaxID=2682486 RepID=UPI0012E1B42C|nr:putative metal-dependent hydrolase [Paenibacillus sp. NEAU-GSW1]MUT67755.1 putative metal-dependent hydrolase [Paenibacillus sp. NEAU-GSW1]
MEDLRYPLGKFEAVANPTSEHRKQWIEEIAQMPEVLRSTIKGLTEEQLNTPYRPGGWTVRQVVHHLADNDMNATLRFKRGLTEDAPTASSYRENLWAELADYNMPVEHSLHMLEGLRGRLTALFRSLSLSELDKTVVSPSYGTMTLYEALQRFAWHGRHHIAQITSLKKRQGW